MTASAAVSRPDRPRALPGALERRAGALACATGSALVALGAVAVAGGLLGLPLFVTPGSPVAMRQPSGAMLPACMGAIAATITLLGASLVADNDAGFDMA